MEQGITGEGDAGIHAPEVREWQEASKCEQKRRTGSQMRLLKITQRSPQKMNSAVPHK
jgi:hypothetical protein